MVWDPTQFLLTICATLLGCVTGGIAQGRGRYVPIWWLFGAVAFPVVLPMASRLDRR